MTIQLETHKIPSDYEIAKYTNLVYEYSSYEKVSWDKLNKGNDIDGVKWAIKHFDNYSGVYFPGTENIQDFIRDINVIPTRDNIIGDCHSGFLSGMWNTVRSILKVLGNKPYVVGGHSMGAAHANILCAYTVALKRPPIKKVLLGEPLSTFEYGSSLSKQVPGSSYVARSGIDLDPITYLPPLVGFTRATKLSVVDVIITEEAKQDLGILAIHYCPGYVKGIYKSIN